MRRLLAFLSNMDAQAWRTLAVSFVLFGGVGVVFVFGAQALGIDSERTLEGWLTAARGPWSLPVAMAAFAALAFIGTPQIVLIAAAVVAFGPWAGAAYSWVGTMVSALVGFWLGRAAGARVLERFQGEGVRRFMTLVGQNGFLASLVVRLVPSAPFIVVNMAAGVTPMRARDFVAGTGIGIVPKIALTAFAGASIVQLMRGEIGRHWVELAAVAALWLALGWFARRWLARRADRGGGEA
ncbi:TVP38/TMEM64 family protein [Phenylobacterium sp.]|uniref:TVP38/TMEM64 family protein n=1 Tax=Phenylobacterium sp. TaxID=1871053 RepID=UPI0025FA5549|nr:TVP38/TMEM64 family protein [Phenylobacterium sp.]MBX3483218.1 TVP38/TMEM64 family protein [Phenylobacterium sp.]MCW5760137.1 TVP38/TMEM64 family protein [Phenylobacterium sp.]